MPFIPDTSGGGFQSKKKQKQKTSQKQKLKSSVDSHDHREENQHLDSGCWAEPGSPAGSEECMPDVEPPLKLAPSACRVGVHFAFLETWWKNTPSQGTWVGTEAAGTHVESGRRTEAQGEPHRKSTLPRAQIRMFSDKSWC